MAGGFKRSGVFGIVGVIVLAVIVVVIATATGQGEASPKTTYALSGQGASRGLGGQPPQPEPGAPANVVAALRAVPNWLAERLAEC